MKAEGIEKDLVGIDGWLSNREADFLYRTARDCAEGGVILEIGSFKGKSTVCLAKGSKAGRGVPVFAIDPHVGTSTQEAILSGRSSFDEFVANINKAQVRELVTPVVKTSQEAAREWHGRISVLWIDGDHTYQGAKLDFDLFSEWVVEGGTIAFHDATIADVPRVVCEAFGRGPFTKIGLVGSIAYATKASGCTKSPADRLLLFCIANSERVRRIWGVKFLKPIIRSVVENL